MLVAASVTPIRNASLWKKSNVLLYKYVFSQPILANQKIQNKQPTLSLSKHYCKSCGTVVKSLMKIKRQFFAQQLHRRSIMRSKNRLSFEL